MIGHHPMTSLTQPETFRWSTTEYPLATLSVRVDVLAARLGFRIDSWEEDGLGPARGAALQLSSGKLIILQELQYMIESGRSEGPLLMVDAGDVAGLGVAMVLYEVLGELGLDSDAVAWMQEPEAQAEAEAQASHALAYFAKRRRAMDGTEA
jgi:hypothetical protein